jgi:hypothetical protein
MTQIEQIIDKLNTDGFVSRNWALQNYIGRLASRMTDLREMGWEFRTENVKEHGGVNYYYHVQRSPLKKEVFNVAGIGQVVRYI